MNKSTQISRLNRKPKPTLAALVPVARRIQYKVALLTDVYGT